VPKWTKNTNVATLVAEKLHIRAAKHNGKDIRNVLDHNSACTRGVCLGKRHVTARECTKSWVARKHEKQGQRKIYVEPMELFVTSQGEVLINEIAPRTHNSGHYSLSACLTSQFALQLQAVANLPLGAGDLKSAGAVMVNLLGFEETHR
jgi:non-ribosomal peptide synthetase component E (peptide arylation enzyme)